MTASDSASISAPVGQDPRPNKGPKVKNAPKDVTVVQELLVKTGAKVRVTGKCDDRLVEAIKKFQKSSAGSKNPDGVVDVGKKTFKKLTELAAKNGKGAKGAAADGDKSDDKTGGKDSGEKEQKYYELDYKGKKVYLTEDEFKKAKETIAKKFHNLYEAIQGQYDTAEAIRLEWIEAAQGVKGFKESVLFITSAWAARLDVPEFSSQMPAMSALAQLKAAVKQNKIDVAAKMFPKASQAVEKYARDVMAYNQKLIGGTGGIVTGLELTRDVSFEIAQTIGTGVLVSRGMSPTAAKATSGAFFSGLKSAATEVGNVTAGKKVTLKGAATNVLVDTAVGGITGGLSGKIKPAFIGKTASWVAGKIVTKQPFASIGVKAAEKFLKTYLAAAGEALVAGAVEEVIKLGGGAVKKGKAPSGDDLVKAAGQLVLKALTAGILKNIEKSTFRFSVTMKKHLNGAIDEDWYFKLSEGQRSKMLHDLLSKQSERGFQAAFKVGYASVIDALKGGESADEIAERAAKAAVSNEKVLKIITNELAKQAEDQKDAA